MKNDIAPEVLAFLKNLPNLMHSKVTADAQGTISKEDEERIKIMLSNAIDPQAQADREALKQYILNQDFKDEAIITNADRKEIGEYIRKYAPTFYRLICKKQ